jgi:5-methylcytosine-specific restriction protein A
MSLYGAITGIFTGRSSKWPAVRKAFLRKHPRCELTGATDNLDVHHVAPFHERPELELDESNMMTLRRDAHLLFGHLGDWQSINPDVRFDVAAWHERFLKRK